MGEQIPIETILRDEDLGDGDIVTLRIFGKETQVVSKGQIEVPPYLYNLIRDWFKEYGQDKTCVMDDQIYVLHNGMIFNRYGEILVPKIR